MKISILSVCRLVQVLFLTCCVSCTNAAETNVTHVNAEQAQKLITDRPVVVLDVRTPEEFAAGHIAGATNLNFNGPNFAKALAALDKNQTYLVHCASGNRSTRALPQFQKLEFKSLYHLDGGLRAWQKAKLPVQQ